MNTYKAIEAVKEQYGVDNLEVINAEDVEITLTDEETVYIVTDIDGDLEISTVSAYAEEFEDESHHPAKA